MLLQASALAELLLVLVLLLVVLVVLLFLLVLLLVVGWHGGAGCEKLCRLWLP